MNPVLILTRNNLDLTKRCVESVRKQDIPVSLIIYDNGSEDGTTKWLFEEHIVHHEFGDNYGVSRGWNSGLRDFFDACEAEHVLVIGNDTVLAPWTYRALLAVDQSFVTGVDIGMEPLPEFPPNPFPLAPHPDFSCFLIRREAWEAIGPFDERLVNYCGDCDYHIRAHRLGIPLWKANIPYNHERSSTMNRATPEERSLIQTRANLDRHVFREIYGCLPGTPEYTELFK